MLFKGNYLSGQISLTDLYNINLKISAFNHFLTRSHKNNLTISNGIISHKRPDNSYFTEQAIREGAW